MRISVGVAKKLVVVDGLIAGLLFESGLWSRVITDPDPVIALSPMETGATSIVFDPMKALAPMVVRCFITPS